LAGLKAAKTLTDLAPLLGFTPAGLSWILYKKAPAGHYRKFEIPKKRGGVRQISAPLGALKMLQRNLSELLYDCRKELQDAELSLAKLEKRRPRSPLSHGFRKGQSIFEHARLHQRRRFVLNLDLNDFFPSFNFGRVLGFFIKDRDFALHKKVATVIAQIACFENSLPQGSPSSPIIADMLAHVLDVRLARLAKAHRVTYSRYADDLTFSTNQRQFPVELARQETGSPASWHLGAALVATIEHANLAINAAKTRMQVRPSRQVVTGLTVNTKVNVSQLYSRAVRSMCHSLFEKGSYHCPKVSGEDAPPPESITSLRPLAGMLSHIHYIKRKAELVEMPHKTAAKSGKETPGRRLYARFLFYRYFVALEQPLIMYEGPTDRIYMKYAIRHLAKEHPQLGIWEASKFTPKVNLLNYYANQSHQILDLHGGSGTLQGFINQYKTNLNRYRHQPLSHPVIVLLDNDQGLSEGLQSALRKNFGVEVGLTTKELFYPLFANLYLVKTIEIGESGKSCIEDCFDASIKTTPLGGKNFDLNKNADLATTYGKKIFAEHVVVPKAGEIDWGGFNPILLRIAAAIDHYKDSNSAVAQVA
jgi:RNA-directed DNA polymerase